MSDQRFNLQDEGGIGASVRRVEDARLLRGRARYVANIDVAGMAWAVFVRSPHAHARILSIDSAPATEAFPDAVVLTGADMQADGIGAMKPVWRVSDFQGRVMREPPRWAMAPDIVRHVGEPVAVVIAPTARRAMAAAELVGVDYDPLDVVTDARAAMADDAPQLHPEAPGNICLRYERGNREAAAEAFAKAARVVEIEVVNPRLAGAAIEPRAVMARWDGDDRELTLWSSTQVPHHIRMQVAEELGLPENRVRVIAPDVGGGFGYKGKHYCEETVLAWAARKLDRPLRWTATRSESFVADLQARDHVSRARMAFDADHRMIGLEVDTVVNIGAYISNFGIAVPTLIYGALLSEVYRIPAMIIASTCVFTNTPPTDAYRGAGRPEACYLIERLVEKAAFELGHDLIDLKRRNLIPPEAMPYTTAHGVTYDCGNFPKLLDRALHRIDHANFGQRRAESRKAGKLRGLGISMFVESSGVAPSRMAGATGAQVGFFEGAEVQVDRSGSVVALLGTHNHGQGHQTTFAQLVHSILGIPFDEITIVEGDTARIPYGAGTYGSRSMAVGGAALHTATRRVLSKAQKIAAHVLGVTEEEVEFTDGTFRVRNSNRTLTFRDIARLANVAHDLPPGMEAGLHEVAFFDPPNFAFSNGCHAVELEIDPDTGVVELLRYVAVDDVGTVVNPMIVEGQTLGGIVQGLGQALIEQVVFDPDTGQILTGSFMDYGLPRADMLPILETETDESQPFPGNPLGTKGCGEAGTIAAPPAVVLAALDALRPIGVTDLTMPLTPQTVWRAIRNARRPADVAV